MPKYFLCGMILQADRPLPLLTAVENQSILPDIELSHGPIASTDQAIAFSTPFVTIYIDGQALVKIESSLSILVSEGRRITIDANEGTPPEHVMTFLLSSALGLICHQRKLLPLHSSAVKIGNTAIALAGPTTAGKSTFATALVSRGHQLLCDDVTVIHPVDIAIQPSYPAVKLWQDSASALDIRTDVLSRTRNGMMKFHYPISEQFHAEPIALGAIIILCRRSHITNSELVPLDKMSALAQLSHQIYRSRLAKALGSEQACLSRIGDLVSNVPVLALMRPDGFGNLPKTLELIESTASR